MKMDLMHSKKSLMPALVLSGMFLFESISIGQVLPISGISWEGVLGTSGSASSGIQNVIDGKFSTTSFQEWIGPGGVTVDLGVAKNVDRLVMITRPTTGVAIPQQGYVEVSLDGVSWTKVKDYNNSDAVAGGSVLTLGFGTQLARYVRFTMSTPGVNAQIGEIQLFNGNGPRVSLIDRGPSWNATNETSNRYPYYLVDQNPTTFGLYSLSTGYLTLRLDSVEYANGWNSIKLDGRSFPPPGLPSNPGIVTVYVGDDLGNLTSIYSESFSEQESNYSFLLEMGETRTEKYIKIEWEKNPDWTSNQQNVQFFGVDVIPVVPEPRTIVLILVATGCFLLSRGRLCKKGLS